MEGPDPDPDAGHGTIASTSLDAVKDAVRQSDFVHLHLAHAQVSPDISSGDDHQQRDGDNDDDHDDEQDLHLTPSVLSDLHGSHLQITDDVTKRNGDDEPRGCERREKQDPNTHHVRDLLFSGRSPAYPRRR